MRSFFWLSAFGERCTDFSSKIQQNDLATLSKYGAEG